MKKQIIIVIITIAISEIVWLISVTARNAADNAFYSAFTATTPYEPGINRPDYK